MKKSDIKTELDELKKLWKIKSINLQKNESPTIKELESGEILGIKLYPPIGFNPCPQNIRKRNKYFLFYEWCIENDIPLTVHCQKGSYTADDSQKKKFINNANPKNWQKVFEEGKGKFDKLRINFAHFGGEDGVEDMLDWIIDRSSWTHDIIEMLVKYPNTYANLSAYDYSKKLEKKDGSILNPKARLDDYSKNLEKVIELNVKKEKFKGKYDLKDKLLWGSDIPMVNAPKHEGNEYRDYFNKFDAVLNNCDFNDGVERAKWKENLTSKNAKRFLKLI